ncbi:macrophage mannose receptor 1 [Amphiprion ocellaris]|uniref:C-type lectin domain-containing protein n=1 Tax=Amphiprion ocellaris TaxID=80972 RepID=A0AAQ6ABB3_AMPOC|nr:macrophage mannose receptor 1 [Amphiprion ocellaris]
MDRRIFGIFVLSGLCRFSSSLPPRWFHFIDTPTSWSEAQKYCRDKHRDLVSVNDEQELEELAALVGDGVSDVFLGLYRVWGWSRSEADDYREGEPAYWNWAAGEPGSHLCGSLSESGGWSATDCSSSLSFFCYNGFEADLSQRFILVSSSMDWASAQLHCRNLHSDLARVRNQEENEHLQKMVNRQRVWIGMMRATWRWSDGSEASFLPWKPLHPTPGGNCGVLDVNNLGMTDRSCAEKHPFFCYSISPAPQRKHILVRVNLVSSVSVDVNDPTVMESILKEVERKLGGADMKVSWKKPPEKKYLITEEQCGPEITHVI